MQEEEKTMDLQNLESQKRLTQKIQHELICLIMEHETPDWIIHMFEREFTCFELQENSLLIKKEIIHPSNNAHFCKQKLYWYFRTMHGHTTKLQDFEEILFHKMMKTQNSESDILCKIFDCFSILEDEGQQEMDKYVKQMVVIHRLIWWKFRAIQGGVLSEYEQKRKLMDLNPKEGYKNYSMQEVNNCIVSIILKPMSDFKFLLSPKPQQETISKKEQNIPKIQTERISKKECMDPQSKRCYECDQTPRMPNSKMCSIICEENRAKRLNLKKPSFCLYVSICKACGDEFSSYRLNIYCSSSNCKRKRRNEATRISKSNKKLKL